jgi:hypothetical protein
MRTAPTALTVVAFVAGLAACSSSGSPPPAAFSAQSPQSANPRDTSPSAVVTPETTSPRALRTTFAQAASVDISLSRMTHSSIKSVPAVHRTVTGGLAASVAQAADSAPILIKTPDCLGYSPVNLEDTLVFRDAAGRDLGTVYVGGCPTPVAHLRAAAAKAFTLTPGSDLDAAALVALGLPASYGLI